MEIHCSGQARKTKPIQSEFQRVGSDAEWIPAFAGMTSMESLRGGEIDAESEYDLKKQSQFQNR